MGEEVRVISFGGSIVAPQRLDVELLRTFRAAIERRLDAHPTERFAVVVGGGGPAREYQRAYREAVSEADNAALDWIGIAATRLNAQLVHGVLRPWSGDSIVVDPTSVERSEARVIVAGGWKPGFSTDYVAVLLAERFASDCVVNLSNISYVYSSDPRHDPLARPLERISWSQLRALVGDRWAPGANAPFDPIASARAAAARLRVIVASGKDIPNLEAILDGRSFEGSTIGPE